VSEKKDHLTSNEAHIIVVDYATNMWNELHERLDNERIHKYQKWLIIGRILNLLISFSFLYQPTFDLQNPKTKATK